VLHFELQSSDDGISFQTKSIIPASNIATGSSYSKNDVPNSKNQTIFYRLKMVDRDGQFSYSAIISLQQAYSSKFVITGNPFNESINITLNSLHADNITLSIFDASGKQLVKKVVGITAGVNRVELNRLSHLPKGTYLLEIVMKDQRITRKLARN
jgi:hypothetical protein